MTLGAIDAHHIYISKANILIRERLENIALLVLHNAARPCVMLENRPPTVLHLLAELRLFSRQRYGP